MKLRFENFFFVVAAPILVACTTSNPQEPAVTSTLIPTILPTSASQEAAVTSTSIPTILPTPASIVSFKERLLATVAINYPDELVFVQDFIWVKTDNGHVIQVDPATNRIVSDTKVDTTSDPYHYCQGLGTDGENIWVCSASGDEDHRTIDVVRLDPSSQNVVETFKVGKIFDQFNMPFLLNQIWVLSGKGDKLVGIDVSTNKPSPAIELGFRCFQVAVVSHSLVVTCRLDNLILQIDPEKREVIKRLTFKSPGNIAATAHGIWLSEGNALIRLDPESLAPVIAFTKLSNADIFTTKEAVWVRRESGFLYQIDPTSNELIEQIKTDQNLSIGSIVVTSNSIWTTANKNNLLIRLSLK